MPSVEKKINKKLVFENGRVFKGSGFGADVEKVCEVVFNTAVTGYQEIFSDSSCYGQFVCMTYPLIGNYGMAADDYQNKNPKIGGFIVKEYNDSLSNFRAAKTLSEEMEENNIPGIEGLDTRMLCRMLRKEGSMKAMLCSIDKNEDEALEEINKTIMPNNQVEMVSCKKRWYSRTAGVVYNVVVIDCGVKLGIIDSLIERCCNVTVIPYNSSIEDIHALYPDGVIISNGPGNPKDVPCVIELVKKLQGQIPLFGINLGHEIIALANGCETFKLKQGHRGGNYPVLNVNTGKIEITSQGHSYTVDAESVKNSSLKISHKNLLDDTVEGLENERQFVFSVQYQPESRPGPQDSTYLFDKFLDNMKHFKNKRI